MKNWLVVLPLAFLFPVAAAAQSGPSLSVTESWISTNVSSLTIPFQYRNTEKSVQTLKADGCQLSWHLHETNEVTPGHMMPMKRSRELDFIVPFARAHSLLQPPARSATGDWVISVVAAVDGTSPGGTTTYEHLKYVNDERTYYDRTEQIQMPFGTDLVLHFPSEAPAQRVYKAFSRWFQLCRATQPF